VLVRFTYLLLIFSILSGCGQTRKSNVKVLKLAHSLNMSHPVHKGMAFMAERVEEYSHGKLKIDIYPSGQLGNERELLELLQIGSLTMTKVSVAVMENFAPDYKVFGLPYLFQDKQHLYKVLDGPIGEQMLADGRQYRLLGLCFYDAGSRSFYTTEKKIQTPEDLKGLKIRVMKSNSAVNMVNALNGAPTPISFGELYSALQQGVVDGAENNPPSFYSSRHYEVCKYYTLDEHTTIPDVLLVSTVWWDALSDEEKQWLRKAAQESVVYQRKLWADSEQESLEAVKAAGVEVIYPDKSKFNEQVQSVYSDYETDARMSELIDHIHALGQKQKENL